MHKLAAVVIMVVFASLNAIDRICCPDGCTHEEETSSGPDTTQPSDGVCVLCVGLENARAADASPGALAATEIVRTAITTPAEIPPDPPEHPPRYTPNRS